MIQRLLGRFRRSFLGVMWKFSTDGGAATSESLRLSVKTLGYHLARELAKKNLSNPDVSGQPRNHGLKSKATTQADIEAPWFAWWCRELAIAPIYHRKLWEYAFLLQALFEEGMLRPGVSGIGFGCGEEPIASYLAARGAQVTVTDLDPRQSRGKGWTDTGQHTSAVALAYKPELLPREEFDRRVSLRFVDMRAIPNDLDAGHDFCWSLCALEHLGSLAAGLTFIEDAMATLKPGGVAVHTTEFNYASDTDTLESESLSLFQRKHFILLKRRLEAAGHTVRELDFDVGNGVLDGFVDVPPFGARDAAHLKAATGLHPSTSFGLVIRRGSGQP
jgi:2-polyprenyl-3-methyl-5-hydroxy-6-metoxy-1,4-benzoquinol methylase